MTEQPSKRVTDGLGDPACPQCHGLGYVREDVPVGHTNFGKLSLCVCSLDDVQAKQIKHYLSISNTESLSGKTFDNFLPEGVSPSQEHRASIQGAHRVCQEFSDNPNGRWILLSGPYGCGKTHLAAAIANRHIDQHKPVIFINTADLLDQLRATFSPSTPETLSEKLEEIKNIGMLILDDLGTESPTPWAVEKLYQVINHRYNAKLPTVITTNRSVNRLEPRIGSRLQDLSLVTHLDVVGSDFRSGKTAANVAGLYTWMPDTTMTFATWDPRNDIVGDHSREFKLAVKEARTFADEPEGWLILVGPSGSGKTHLAS